MFTLVWLIRGALGKLQPFEREIMAHGLGLWAPEMRPHWSRFARAFLNPPDLSHAIINLPVEWARLDPQRAAKVGVMDQAFAWALLVVVLLIA